jgi:hypothetical protein
LKEISNDKAINFYVDIKLILLCSAILQLEALAGDERVTLKIMMQ